MSMADDLTRFRQRTMARAEKVRRGTTFKLFAAVIKDTPVGNWRHWNISPAQKEAVRKSGYVGGRLRANWQVSIGTPDRSTSTPPNDIGTIHAKLLRVINDSKMEDEVNLTNSLPYAHRIEYEGWSSKSPHGMVRRNVTRFLTLLRGQLSQL